MQPERTPVSGAGSGGGAFATRGDLSSEPSRYLQRLQNNLVNWRPWNGGVLEIARGQDRPILLSFGFSSCHWCHQMEREVFSDHEVAAFLNQNFVCIKVDSEERPDLVSLYHRVVGDPAPYQAGAPLNVFLTPAGLPIVGSTFSPRDRFLSDARLVHIEYNTQRPRVEQDSSRLGAGLIVEVQRSTGDRLDRALLESAIIRARERPDADRGDRLRSQSPPPVARWRFLLHQVRRTRDEQLTKALRTILNQVAIGAVYDHVGGGFHQFLVEPSGRSYTFVKRLSENAQLAELYAEAAALFDDRGYARVAQDVFDFLWRDMRIDHGAYCASLETHAEEAEQSHYLWSPEQLEEVAGEDGPPLARLLGVTADGGFAGWSVPTRRTRTSEVALDFGLPPGRVESMVTRWRPALRALRYERERPVRDGKVVSAWNGLAIGALSRASLLLDHPAFNRAAMVASVFLWQHHRQSEGYLSRCSTDQKPSGQAILDDYAFLARGFLYHYEGTGDALWLKRALDILNQVQARFAHPQGGAFLTASLLDETMVGRPFEVFDGSEPSGNGVLLEAQIRAALLTGRHNLLGRAEQTLAAHAELISAHSLEMSSWLDAADLFRGPVREVVIAGEKQDPQFAELLGVYRACTPFHAVLTLLPAAGADTRHLALAPVLRGKRALSGRATAYVSERGRLLQTTQVPEELRLQLDV